MAQGHLDHKAISIWAVMPGVEYMLCVKFDPAFRIQVVRCSSKSTGAAGSTSNCRSKNRDPVGRTSNPRYSARDGAPDSFPGNSVGGFVLSIGLGNALIRRPANLLRSNHSLSPPNTRVHFVRFYN
ncbi:hypothetical protein GQ600_25859 [Phytophthora cactorum]|nr:hypothetical protein GQ600_25859 [Phytophthora cactorum]